MKKLLSTVLFSAVALSAVALSKPSHVSAATKDTGSTTVSAPASDKTEADVTYNGGATTVWTSPTVGQQAKRYVTTGEHLQFVNSKKVYAEIWYETADHGWVPERYLNINTLQQLAPLTQKADGSAAPTQTKSPAEQAAQSTSNNAQASSSAAAQSAAAASAAAQQQAQQQASQAAPASQAAAQHQAQQSAAAQQQAQQQAVAQQQAQQPAAASQAAASQAAAQQQQAQQPSNQSTVQTTQQQTTQQQTTSNQGTFRVTFYDPAVLRSSLGYGGVAANLNVFPKGTHLRITMSNGQVLDRVVNDTGSFAAGNSRQIDVAMPNDQIPSAGVLSATVEVIG
ncbi:hydrolase [Lacticaseibacillus chiayiensis]|uniref:hydrolase n=1 Tax=Lacticaseibacillus chiayiensis TaxID=2100821 RepID=UPI001012A8C6|nr:hydrolase [Lacticaseibacillus chiayiensis]RXT57839.1 hydrolase [Lacticaseibacillus chiayiensis]